MVKVLLFYVFEWGLWHSQNTICFRWWRHNLWLIRENILKKFFCHATNSILKIKNDLSGKVRFQHKKHEENINVASVLSDRLGNSVKMCRKLSRHEINQLFSMIAYCTEKTQISLILNGVLNFRTKISSGEKVSDFKI